LNRFKDAEHLIRLAGVFLLGLIAFVILRAATIPQSFGQYGPYRGAAIRELTSHPVALPAMTPARIAIPMSQRSSPKASTRTSTASPVTDRSQSTPMIPVKPTYRLALLTALAFLIVAPLPLQLHLGHPERSLEMYLTPHRASAMAMFGFVYLWYLMAVLVLEIWLDYRMDIVLMAQTATGWRRIFYRVLTLGSYNISPRALRIDERVGWIITLVGIPSAFLLHGYVGFIFGSVKANPWWSTPLMPVVFLFSAIVSGIALVMIMYMFTCYLRGVVIDMGCL
jgi:hypothetical protein